MSTVTADIDVDVPVRVAYDQWTQFEEFPHFMGGVDSITQIDDTTNHWKVSIGGVKREFDADISDQVPDDHVSWVSIGEGDVNHRGRVQFTPAKNGGGTNVEVTIEWEPKGIVEKAGAALGVDDAQVKGDLKRFKEFIEERRTPTGEWRGEVHEGQTTDGGSGGLGSTTSGSVGTGAGAVGVGSVQPTGDAWSSDDIRGTDPDLRA